MQIYVYIDHVWRSCKEAEKVFATIVTITSYEDRYELLSHLAGNSLNILEKGNVFLAFNYILNMYRTVQMYLHIFLTSSLQGRER
jgi:hypothetical protein